MANTVSFDRWPDKYAGVFRKHAYVILPIASVTRRLVELSTSKSIKDLRKSIDNRFVLIEFIVGSIAANDPIEIRPLSLANHPNTKTDLIADTGNWNIDIRYTITNIRER